MTRVLISSPVGQERQRFALQWLAARPRDARLLIVAPTLDAGQQLLCAAVAQQGSVFGWHCESLGSLAGKLAALPLARAGLSPVAALGVEALAARTVFESRAELGRLAAVGERPGLARALARTLSDLALSGVEPDAAELDRDLGRLYAHYRELLARAGLADRARVLREAASVGRAGTDPLAGLPLLLWDVRVAARAERELIAALAERAQECAATVPTLDLHSLGALEQALSVRAQAPASAERSGPGAGALRRLQRQLFSAADEPGELGDEVAILSAPGEARECVEIARRVLREAERGVAFDRMAILLRAPELYRVHLCEALRRAGVAAHFSRGSSRPEPRGRALLALLACAAEKFSARRFAEYLSLGVVPKLSAAGEPPGEGERGEWFVVPEDEELPVGGRERGGEGEGGGEGESERVGESEGGVLAAPRKWERLLCEAAVMGGRGRWERRLAGLERELGLAQGALGAEDDARREAIGRDLQALRGLRTFALPLIDALAGLPRQASWGEWIDALAALATRAIARPAAVLQGLTELAPMAPIGPVGIEEVRLVLERRFGEQLVRPHGHAEGKVLVASIDEARGRVFDVVFVPGLAEKIFPGKLYEDPLLLDAARARVSAELRSAEHRIADERSALQIAVGAARERLVVSYPRFAAERARPRVPSFYALELLRAAEGKLPGWGALQRRATADADVRMGWPAPRDARDAIDAAEYDLCVLHEYLNSPQGDASGAAHYLLTANPHLGRALRFRARRWHKRWHAADGLVLPDQAGLAALQPHRPAQRMYSATALERYARCPYQFYLSAIVGLAPREQPVPLETLGPLQRGVLVHDVLREFLSRLRSRGQLPITAASRESALGELDAVLDELAERQREQLAPAIERVWHDGIAEIRGDLREWLLRAADDGGWLPTHFELGFGLLRADSDPASAPEPVELESGLRLRGSIDLIERNVGNAKTALRAVDYKTGLAPDAAYVVIAGGRMLQPALYAQVARKLFPDAVVSSGQAYYCSSRGGFRKLDVVLDARAERAVATVATTIDSAIQQGFLPAAPDKDACERCDYLAICGPYEPLRIKEKDKSALEPLVQLRREP